MEKCNVFVDGEHGTTGLQIISRLKKRDDVNLLSVPHNLRHEKNARKEMLNNADFAILCLPDDAAKEAVSMVNGSTRIIDASTAHRVNDDWVFGFLELEPNHADNIKNADRVSNPGCYSTAAIAILRPLTKAGILPKDSPVTITGVSGYSGGGKKLIAEMEETQNENAPPHYAYATGLTHKHVPEIKKYSMLKNEPIFLPAVGKYKQGMIVQVPLHTETLNVNGKDGREQVHNAISQHYKNSEFVRVATIDESNNVQRVDPTELVGTDNMDIYVFGNGNQVNVVASLDNLGKGASGACVQSLNVMLGV